MKFAKGNELLRIFSYQDHFNGQRRYLASTYKEFWKRFSFLFILVYLDEFKDNLITYFSIFCCAYSSF